MVDIVQTGKYGAVNTTDAKIIRYYVIKYVSDTFTIQ